MTRTRRELLGSLSSAGFVTALAGCIGGGGNDTTTTTTTTETTATTTTEQGPTPSLSVSDQETDGTTVTVPSAAIDGEGWLVVHPETDGGGPNGKVTLATKQLQPGSYSDVTLELDESLSESQTVYAMLHYDDPADGEFTFPGDGDPPVKTDGSPLVKPFEATVSGMGGSKKTVEMVDTSFKPMQASVEPGTTVEWVNQDSFGHDVTSAQFHDAATQWDFASDVSPGGSVTYTFDSEGVYEYYCTIHGKDSMCGVVLVGDVSLDEELPCEGGYDY
jgi:plastocyanin